MGRRTIARWAGRPQLEDGHVRIAQELQAAIARVPLRESSRRVLDAVVMVAYSWRRRTVDLSIRDLQDLTGMPRQGVYKGRDDLVDRRILTYTAPPSRGGLAVWKLNTHYGEWLPPVEVPSVVRDIILRHRPEPTPRSPVSEPVKTPVGVNDDTSQCLQDTSQCLQPSKSHAMTPLPGSLSSKQLNRQNIAELRVPNGLPLLLEIDRQKTQLSLEQRQAALSLLTSPELLHGTGRHLPAEADPQHHALSVAAGSCNGGDVDQYGDIVRQNGIR